MTFEYLGFGDVLPREKEIFTEEEFIGKFYRNIKLNSVPNKGKCFDELLKILYKKEEKEYSKYRNVFRRIPLTFIKNNLDLIKKLLQVDNYELIKDAYEMEKKRKSLISGCIPMRATPTTVNESKEKLYVSLNMNLALLDSELEDNLLSKTKDKFYLTWGKYEDNMYLGDLYNEIMDSFENNIREALIREINKIEGINKELLIKQNQITVYDDAKLNRMSSRLPKTYKSIYYK